MEAGPLKIVVVGCGIAGITFAIQLKRQLKPGTYHLTIYEKNDGPGGTWKENTYPGCACDVESHYYSLSTHLNPNWSKRYADRLEILAYWEEIFNSENLTRYVHFNTTHISSTWDPSSSTYTSTFTRKSSASESETFTVTSDVLISAIGCFSAPRIPAALEEKGIKSFAGDYWHSARWNPQNVTIEGKRVGVIGNGCSASQLIPKVAEMKGVELWNFIRGRNWYMYRDTTPYSALTKWAFKWIPGVMKAYRLTYFLRNEARWLFARNQEGIVNRLLRKVLRGQVENLAPKNYIDKLIPNFPVGCKRLIIDNDYLTSLNWKNVHLVTDEIAKFEEKGIRLATGDLIPLDVIVLATGYDVSSKGFGINVTGKNGVKIYDQWEEQGGAQAFHGTTVHNFPNFFLIVGPNTLTGHTSVIAYIEIQTDYILKFVKRMVKEKIKSFEVKKEAEDNFNTWIQKKLRTSAQGADCGSWYRLGLKNPSSYPGTTTSFWWGTRKIDTKAYDTVR